MSPEHGSLKDDFDGAHAHASARSQSPGAPEQSGADGRGRALGGMGRNGKEPSDLGTPVVP